VLLALVEAGMSRDDAYRTVQELAQEVSARGGSNGDDFRTIVAGDSRVRGALSDERIAAAFDLARVVRHAGRAVDALDGAAGGPAS
jgi:adenylosuccinate lyase